MFGLLKFNCCCLVDGVINADLLRDYSFGKGQC